MLALCAWSAPPFLARPSASQVANTCLPTPRSALRYGSRGSSRSQARWSAGSGGSSSTATSVASEEGEQFAFDATATGGSGGVPGVGGGSAPAGGKGEGGAHAPGDDGLQGSASDTWPRDGLLGRSADLMEAPEGQHGPVPSLQASGCPPLGLQAIPASPASALCLLHSFGLLH